MKFAKHLGLLVFLAWTLSVMGLTAHQYTRGNYGYAAFGALVSLANAYIIFRYYRHGKAAADYVEVEDLSDEELREKILQFQGYAMWCESGCAMARDSGNGRDFSYWKEQGLASSEFLNKLYAERDKRKGVQVQS